jgi:hypothetical protein
MASRVTWICALAISFVFVGSTQANTVLFDNLGPGGTYSTNGNFGLGIGAVEFTSPVNALFADAQIPLAIFGNGVNQVTVDLQADASGEPSGIDLDSITVTVPVSFPGSLVTATSILNPELTAGTSYWLVLDYAPIDIDTDVVSWYTSTTSSTPFDEADAGASGPWFASPVGSISPAFEIDGTIVPEPGSMTLIGAGLVVLSLASKLRPSRF